jgi:phosphoglucosamine mutase
MVRTVLEKGADLGIALDGDADRTIMCDEKGNLVDGDDILFLSSLELQETGRLENSTVVGTIMTNVGLQSALGKRGIILKRAPVGDRYVLEEMDKTGSVLGAEPSGHVIFSQHAPTGDGVVTSLKVIAAMVRKNCSLSSLTEGWKRYPQVMVNLRVGDKIPLDGQDWFEELLENARVELGDDHLLSMRYSGTEPLIRVTVSSESESQTVKVCDDLCESLIQRFGWERI